jgi:DDE superfamily endonuclease
MAYHAHNGGPAPDEDDDDDDFVVQYLSTFLQTRTLLGNAVRSVLVTAARRRAGTVHGGDDAAAPRPGRGVAASGAKAEYVRVGGTGKYQAVRNSHDPLLFQAYVRMSTDDFDYILGMAREDVDKPLNHDLRFTCAENDARQPRKRILDAADLLFLYLHALRGGTKGGQGVRMLADTHGVSKSMISIYFAHAAHALFTALSADEEMRVKWPTAAERLAMRDTIVGFPMAVFFVDGTKITRFRPTDPNRQEALYHGHHHKHCSGVLVWSNVYGTTIRLGFLGDGCRHDRGIYNSSCPNTTPTLYFSPGEVCIGETGFVGEGDHLICPFKKNQGALYRWREMWNRDIRKQRIRNEWGLGFLMNRWRVFLGEWPYDESVFVESFTVAAMLCNMYFRRRGRTHVTPESIFKHLEKEVNGNW